MLLASLNLIFWIHVPSFNDLNFCLMVNCRFWAQLKPVCMPPPPPLSSGSWHTFCFEVYSTFTVLIEIVYRLGTKPPFSFTVLECFLASRSRGEYWANKNPSSPNLKTALVQKTLLLDIEHLSYCSWSSSSFTSPAWNLSKRSWSLLGLRLNANLEYIRVQTLNQRLPLIIPDAQDWNAP